MRHILVSTLGYRMDARVVPQKDFMNTECRSSTICDRCAPWVRRQAAHAVAAALATHLHWRSKCPLPSEMADVAASAVVMGSSARARISRNTILHVCDVFVPPSSTRAPSAQSPPSAGRAWRAVARRREEVQAVAELHGAGAPAGRGRHLHDMRRRGRPTAGELPLQAGAPAIARGLRRPRGRRRDAPDLWLEAAVPALCFRTSCALAGPPGPDSTAEKGAAQAWTATSARRTIIGNGQIGC